MENVSDKCPALGKRGEKKTKKMHEMSEIIDTRATVVCVYFPVAIRLPEQPIRGISLIDSELMLHAELAEKASNKSCPSATGRRALTGAP